MGNNTVVAEHFRGIRTVSTLICMIAAVCLLAACQTSTVGAESGVEVTDTVRSAAAAETPSEGSPAAAAFSQLPPGKKIKFGARVDVPNGLVSPNGKAELSISIEGSLVMTVDGKQVWSTPSAEGRQPIRDSWAEMKPDGNLVAVVERCLRVPCLPSDRYQEQIYSTQTATSRTAGGSLRLYDDGKAAISSAGCEIVEAVARESEPAWLATLAPDKTYFLSTVPGPNTKSTLVLPGASSDLAAAALTSCDGKYELRIGSSLEMYQGDNLVWAMKDQQITKAQMNEDGNLVISKKVQVMLADKIVTALESGTDQFPGAVAVISPAGDLEIYSAKDEIIARSRIVDGYLTGFRTPKETAYDVTVVNGLEGPLLTWGAAVGGYTGAPKLPAMPDAIKAGESRSFGGFRSNFANTSFVAALEIGGGPTTFVKVIAGVNKDGRDVTSCQILGEQQAKCQIAVAGEDGQKQQVTISVIPA